MQNPRQKEYDDEELVLAIASGAKPHRQIAREFGLSPTMVCLITKGQRRPELLPRIVAATAEFRERARRLAGSLAAALGRLGSLIAGDGDVSPQVQLRAAVEILKFALGAPVRAEPVSSQPIDPEFTPTPESEPIYERILTARRRTRPRYGGWWEAPPTTPARTTCGGRPRSWPPSTRPHARPRRQPPTIPSGSAAAGAPGGQVRAASPTLTGVLMDPISLSPVAGEGRMRDGPAGPGPRWSPIRRMS